MLGVLSTVYSVSSDKLPLNADEILNKIMQTKITIDEIFFIMIHTSPIFIRYKFQ